MQTMSAEQIPSSTGTASAETILIVDDMPDNLCVLGDLLREAGYQIKAASSGAIALQCALQQPSPALILLDVLMPEMDGYEVLRQLGEAEATRDIPVIFLTALDDPKEVAHGMRLGAADYITKPIHPEEVLARVYNQLEVRRVGAKLKHQNATLETEVACRVAEIQRIQEECNRAQATLHRQRELILASVVEGIFGVDNQCIIRFTNPAASLMLGYSAEELCGRSAGDFIVPSSTNPQEAVEYLIAVASTSGVAISGREMLFRHKNGHSVALEMVCTPIIEDGLSHGAVVTLLDLSERQHYLEQVERHSNYDDQTGLPNRNLLNDRLAHAIKRSLRKEGGTLAVLTLNLDRFKNLINSLGHGVGGQVLHWVAQRLGASIRGMDTLARIEGDEFVLVVETTEPDAVGTFCRTLLTTFRSPFSIEGHELFLTASVGIALFGKDGENGASLLLNSAAAMYKARADGGDRFRFYSDEMNARLLERLDMENGLRQAFDRDELEVYYQPQVSLRSGEIIGAEALLRWHHPQRGLLMPAEFIPLAEHGGLIVPLGERVLHSVCCQNKAWQEAGLPAVAVAVNMSARQFANQGMVKLVAEILEKTGLNPDYLKLELAESAIMANADAFFNATEQLSRLSITLSINDSGAGFSSLKYLKRLAIDHLKINRSFVCDITQDTNSAAIALAIISLAHSLKLSVIAEGVETEAQLNFLRQRGCDEMQGYYFSPAVPAKEFEQLLREGRRLEFPVGAQRPGHTLLLVDDEPGILSALKRLFRREGYTILTAESGMAGLEVLASQEVGVVISDARMPGMSGGEFLGKVREMHPDTVRLMLSGYTDLNAVTSAVNRGELFRFITKPWDDTGLLDTVRDAFHHYEQRHKTSLRP